MSSLSEIERNALTRSPGDRAQLAGILLASLEETAESPEMIEKLWIEECERRFERFRNGSDEGVPAEIVFAELRQRNP